MHPLVRRLLSVIGAVILAALLVNTMDAVREHLFPLPEGTNASDSASMKQAFMAQPAPAFLLILIGWTAGAGIGAYAACQFNGRTARWPGIAVGAIVLGGAVLTMIGLPHPTWLWVAAVPLVPGAGIVGTRLAMRHPADAEWSDAGRQ